MTIPTTSTRPLLPLGRPLTTITTALSQRRPSTSMSDSPETPVSLFAYEDTSTLSGHGDSTESERVLTPLTAFSLPSSSRASLTSRRALFYIADSDQDPACQDEDEDDAGEWDERWQGMASGSKTASYAHTQVARAATTRHCPERTQSLKALQRRPTSLYPDRAPRKSLEEPAIDVVSPPLSLPFFSTDDSCALKRRSAIRRKRASSLYDNISVSTEAPLWPPSEFGHLDGGHFTQDGVPFYALQGRSRPRKAATIHVHQRFAQDDELEASHESPLVDSPVASPNLARDSAFTQHLRDERRLSTSPSQEDFQPKVRPELTVITEEGQWSSLVRRISRRGKKAKKNSTGDLDVPLGCVPGAHKRRFSLPTLRFNRHA